MTTRVECSAFFPARDAALRAHATQVDPEGMFFSLPREEEAGLWPTEDYELARTLLAAPATGAGDGVVEDDLFAGVLEHLGAQRA